MVSADATQNKIVTSTCFSDHSSESPASAPWNPSEDANNFSQWADAMAAGNFEYAWQINAQHGKRWPSAHQIWNGEPLYNRDVCLHCLHGLGDFVQCIRFVPQLLRQGCRVSCVVAPSLLPLSRYFDGVTAVYGYGDSVAYGAEDTVHVELMELLHIIRLSSADLPQARNYLWLPYEVKASMKARMGTAGRPQIGLVWRGGQWDPERWIPFSALEPLFSISSFGWWSLQAGETVSDLGSAPVRRFNQLVPNGNLVDLAAAISNMKLLITTDTLAAHIAGAMGVPAWVLLKNDPDWRWLQKTDRSPWYSSLRLFRQHSPGDWPELIQRVRDALLKERAQPLRVQLTSLAPALTPA